MQFLKLGSISPTINRFYFAKALSLKPFWSKKPPSTETRDGEPPSLIPLEPEQAEVKSVDTQEIRLEKFIPVTRRTLLRTLVEEKGFLKNEEREKMESLGASLDAKYSQTFYSILEEAKVRERNITGVNMIWNDAPLFTFYKTLWLEYWQLAIKERTTLPFLIVLNLALAYYIASLALNT